MKTLISMSVVMAALSSSFAFAESSEIALFVGTVDNFNNRAVQMILATGTRIEVPRADADRSEVELRPGRKAHVVARVDEIRILAAKAE